MDVKVSQRSFSKWLSTMDRSRKMGISALLFGIITLLLLISLFVFSYTRGLAGGPGPQGPQDPIGETGDQGPAGSQGSSGPQGDPFYSSNPAPQPFLVSQSFTTDPILFVAQNAYSTQTTLVLFNLPKPFAYDVNNQPIVIPQVFNKNPNVAGASNAVWSATPQSWNWVTPSDQSSDVNGIWIAVTQESSAFTWSTTDPVNGIVPFLQVFIFVANPAAIPVTSSSNNNSLTTTTTTKNHSNTNTNRKRIKQVEKENEGEESSLVSQSYQHLSKLFSNFSGSWSSST